MLSIFLKIAREPVVSLYFSFIFLNEGKVLLQKFVKITINVNRFLMYQIKI